MCTFFITSSVGLTVFSNTYPTNIQPPKYRIDFQIRALLPIFTCLKVSKTDFLKLICRLLCQNYLHGTDCVHLNLIGILYVHASSHLTFTFTFYLYSYDDPDPTGCYGLLTSFLFAVLIMSTYAFCLVYDRLGILLNTTFLLIRIFVYCFVIDESMIHNFTGF